MNILLAHNADPRVRTPKGLLAEDLYQQQKAFMDSCCELEDGRLNEPFPSEVTNDFWLSCSHTHVRDTCASEPGKWMLFYPRDDELDSAWSLAKTLYRQGVLKGVKSLKVSTAAIDRRQKTRNGDDPLRLLEDTDYGGINPNHNHNPKPNPDSNGRILIME